MVLDSTGRPILEEDDDTPALLGSITTVGGVQVVVNAGVQVGVLHQNAAGHPDGFTDQQGCFTGAGCDGTS